MSISAERAQRQRPVQRRFHQQWRDPRPSHAKRRRYHHQRASPSDFNGDALSDILWQNASSGQASITEMNGNAMIGGEAVSPNPGPSWRAVGAGNFNGDGLSDILWQNTSTGQVSIWEMSGTTRIGGGALANPGLAWQAIGTGDFNGDGFSDILWQNTSGQVSVWEMNGTQRIGGGAVSPNPGPSWRAVGACGKAVLDLM
jgi:hypothetical protein